MDCDEDAYEEATDGLQSSEEWIPSFYDQQTLSPGHSCSHGLAQISVDANESSRDVNVVLLPDDDAKEIAYGKNDSLGENELTMLPDDAEKSFVFFFKATLLRRLNRGQMRPREIGTLNVGGNTMQEVIGFIWKLVKKHVMRQIVFDEDGPKWAEKQLPDEEDVEKFVTLHDQTKKKTYAISAITPRVLATWKDKHIKIFVHAYSVNVETNAQHQMILKLLIAPNNPDRSGAHSTHDNAALAKELKESHPDLEGHHSSWLLWANFIHSSAAHKHELLKIDPTPPLELAKYFRWTNVSEAARLQSVHHGVTVAHTINDGWTRDVEEIFQGLSTALSILQNVSQKLEALISKGTAALPCAA